MGQEQLICWEERSLEISHINLGELIGLHILIYSLCLFLVTLETYSCTTATSTVVKQDHQNVHKLVSFIWIAQCNYVFYV